jgi:hypothetical protein
MVITSKMVQLHQRWLAAATKRRKSIYGRAAKDSVMRQRRADGTLRREMVGK